jgi:MFS family permease
MGAGGAAVIPALAAMLAVQALVSVSGMAVPVLAPLAAADLGLPAHLVGYYVSVTYGMAATAGLVSGGFIARYGALRVSQACLVFSAAAMALASAGGLPALAAAALVMGLGYGPATPASSHVLARVTPREWMNLVFSLKQTGVPLGNALAGAILPALGLLVGWRLAALAAGLVCLALALALQPLRPRFDHERQVGLRFSWRAQLAAPLGLVLRTPAIRRLSLTSLAYSGMQVCLGAFLVTFLESLGMPLVAAGFALSASQVAAVVGRTVWGVVADRLVPPRLVLGGLGLGMTAAALLIGQVSAAWPYLLVVVVCVAMGGTAVAWNGVLLAQLARLAPPGRAAEVTGASAFFMFGGVMIAPAVFSALLSATHSYALAFAVTAAGTCVAGLSYFIGGRRAEA